MNNFGVVYTKQKDWLLSCIVTGSYGESIAAFENPYETDWLGVLRNIDLDDRIFLNYNDTILVGPLIITRPHDNFSINLSKKNWHKVDCNNTIEPKPIWCKQKPWCIFFEKMLLSQAKYIWIIDPQVRIKYGLPKTKIGPLDETKGKKLWVDVTEIGGNFSEFIQRNQEFMESTPQIFSHYSKEINSSKLLFPIRTNDGKYVRNKSEKIIADVLYSRNYSYAYEYPLIIGGYLIRPDFFIPKCDLIIEHLGMLDNNQYQEDWLWKENLYKHNNIKFITTTEQDIPNIDSILLKKLKSKNCI